MEGDDASAVARMAAEHALREAHHGTFAPLLWFLVFAAGFQNVFGVAIVPPYETYIEYQVYLVPGLVGMVALFNGMQSSLAMVYDREMGVMRLLLTAPLPRWWILACKLLGGAALSLAPQLEAMGALRSIQERADFWLVPHAEEAVEYATLRRRKAPPAGRGIPSPGSSGRRRKWRW